MKKILVPVDFSDITQKVIEKGSELACAFKGELRIIHVAAPPPEFVGPRVGPQVVRDQRAKELRNEHKLLQKYATGLQKEGINAKALLIQGPTISTILEQIENFQADFVVMGSHGRIALYRVLLGSVIEGVIRKTVCPVIVIPARRSVDRKTIAD